MFDTANLKLNNIRGPSYIVIFHIECIIIIFWELPHTSSILDLENDKVDILLNFKKNVTVVKLQTLESLTM